MADDYSIGNLAESVPVDKLIQQARDLLAQVSSLAYDIVVSWVDLS